MQTAERQELRLDKKKNIWLSELLQMVKAPTYFAYCLALFLVYFHQYLLVIYANKTAMIATGDSFAYAAARRFGDSFGAFLVIFPAFVIATSLLRDLRVKKLKQIEVREGEPALAAVGVRYITQVALLFLPVLLVTTIAAINLEKTAELDIVVSFTERLRFFEISFVWLLPVIMAVTAVVQLLIEISENCFVGIVGQILIWVFTTGSTAEVGDYNSCLAIRHMQFGAYEAFLSNQGTLAVNRIAIVLISLLIVLATIAIYKKKKA